VKISRTLTILAASGGLAMLSLMSGGAASAGTYISGDWTLVAPGSTTYAAQVLQPINSDGSSVFNHKSSTIPVQYKVTQTQSFAFESVVIGDHVTPGADTTPSLAFYQMPSGITVSDLTGLTADFAWTYGENHSGGFRWQIGTPGGNIMVDYGDAANSLQGDTAGTGINMINSTLGGQNRCETNEVGADLPMYAPWSDVLAHYGGLTVNNVVLVVDGGWGTGPNGTHDQVIDLTDATVTYTGGSSTFTMPGSITTQSNAAPAWISLNKTSGSAPGPVDETTLFSTQGDTGGQFRQVDGKYIYNLPVKSLPDPSATYDVGISFNSAGSAPVGVVSFGLK
jgi:hypothetical protein